MYYIFSIQSIQQVSISISFIFIYQKPCSNFIVTARLSHPVQDIEIISMIFFSFKNASNFKQNYLKKSSFNRPINLFLIFVSVSIIF